MGAFNLVDLVSKAVMAAVTGGMSAIIQAAVQAIARSIGQAILQQIGQALGLPRGIIDQGMALLDKAMGTQGQNRQNLNDAVGSYFGNSSRSTPFQTGQAQRQGQNVVDQAVQQILDNIKFDRAAMDDKGNKKARGQGSAANQSWFLQLAEMLGNILNTAAEELKTKSNATDWKDGQSMSEFNALTQQFNTLMSSINSAIKAIGEAMTSMARKS
jgi:hypothetical protein